MYVLAENEDMHKSYKVIDFEYIQTPDIGVKIIGLLRTCWLSSERSMPFALLVCLHWAVKLNVV